jgi:hypothetical protein
MIEISIALVILGALAWDIARRKLAPSPTKQIEQLRAELAKTDKVIKELAEDWRTKFTQIEAQQKALDKDIMSKVGGTIASLPSKGYHR